MKTKDIKTSSTNSSPKGWRHAARVLSNTWKRGLFTTLAAVPSKQQVQKTLADTAITEESREISRKAVEQQARIRATLISKR